MFIINKEYINNLEKNEVTDWNITGNLLGKFDLNVFTKKDGKMKIAQGGLGDLIPLKNDLQEKNII